MIKVRVWGCGMYYANDCPHKIERHDRECVCVIKAFLTVAEGLTHLTSQNKGKKQNQKSRGVCSSLG